jgi:hypothetical protein
MTFLYHGFQDIFLREMSVRSEIVNGIAEILWAEGWSNHIEEHGCERLGGGTDITEAMPPIPIDANDFAEKWAGEVEQMNGKSLSELYEEAEKANEREGKGSSRRSSPTAFGNKLAFMIEGAGVSWFDDNAEFDLEVPDHAGGGEVFELMHYAGSRCEAAWENPACWRCGTFNPPSTKKCANCGALSDQEED